MFNDCSEQESSFFYVFILIWHYLVLDYKVFFFHIKAWFGDSKLLQKIHGRQRPGLHFILLFHNLQYTRSFHLLTSVQKLCMMKNRGWVHVVSFSFFFFFFFFLVFFCLHVVSWWKSMQTATRQRYFCITGQNSVMEPQLVTKR